MTPEREAEIRRLSDNVESARLLYSMSAQTNLPNDLEKRKASMANHNIVIAKLNEAQHALQCALETNEKARLTNQGQPG